MVHLFVDHTIVFNIKKIDNLVKNILQLGKILNDFFLSPQYLTSIRLYYTAKSKPLYSTVKYGTRNGTTTLLALLVPKIFCKKYFFLPSHQENYFSKHPPSLFLFK